MYKTRNRLMSLNEDINNVLNFKKMILLLLFGQSSGDKIL